MSRLGGVVLALVLAGGSVPAIAQGAAAGAGPPASVPAVRQWVAGAGAGYTFGAATRVVAGSERLRAVAEVFAEDLRSLTGMPVVAVVGGAVRAGDIALGGRPPAPRNPAYRSTPIISEAYQVTVGEALVVQGETDTGVFYGTRTVVQWLRQRHTLPAGSAIDWPAYPERGLLVDAGRRYFSIPWLRERIRELSYLKLNYLHLHLTDRLGFRLESRTHPEIVSPQHYTQQEIADLVAYAARYHVRLVPEIDLPGHADPILAAHPELKLVSRTGEVNHGAIDLSKPAAFDLMRDLLTEFLPLFPDRYWHLGADEYVTDYADYPQLGGKGTFYGFINWANGIVRAAGKTMRIANDGLSPGGGTIDPSISVDHWSRNGPGGLPWTGDAYTAAQLVAAGHTVHNAAFTPTYFTTGGPAAVFNTPPSVMYELWDPSVFVDGTRAASLGSKVSLWCDDPTAMTEPQLAGVLRERLRVMAQHTWGSPKPLLYLSFLSVINAVGQPPA